MGGPKKAPKKSSPARHERKPAAGNHQKNASGHSLGPMVRMAVCGITDPFCKHAIGAKLPDTTNIRTLAYTKHSIHSITTDASGNGGVMVMPNWFYDPVIYGLVSGTNMVLPPVAMTSNPAIAGIQSFRIVSYGLIINSIAAPMTSSGLVYVRANTSETGQHITSSNYASYGTTDYLDVPLRNVSGLAVIGGRNAAPRANFYTPTQSTPSSAVTDWKASGALPTSIVIIGGPASTTVLTVELLIHYELTFEETEGMALAMTPSPASNPMVVNISNQVQSTGQQIFKTGLAAAGKYIEQRALQLITNALPAPYKPIGYAAQYAIMVD